MPNRFWYYFLTAIGIGITVFTMYRKRKDASIAALITFFLAAMSLTMLFEVFVLVIFDGYVYKPQVFTDPYKDNIFGHLLMNSALWPATTLLVGAFSLRYRWIAVITLFYTLIEILFLKLDLYEHHWWQLYMTTVGVFIFHSMARIWYKKLRVLEYNIPWYITFYFAGRRVIGIPLNILDYMGKLKFNIGLMESAQRSNSVFTAIYQFGMSVVLLIFASILKKWYWKLAPIIIFLLINFALMKMGILVFKSGWTLFDHTLVQAVNLIIYIFWTNTP